MTGYIYYNYTVSVTYSCNCRLNKLTWHSDRIPSNEIWVKLGGDKGGSSFKMNFQILNVENPNSIHNTCVFTAFQAVDTLFNLHVALDRYSEQVNELQQTEWRYVLSICLTIL